MEKDKEIRKKKKKGHKAGKTRKKQRNEGGKNTWIAKQERSQALGTQWKKKRHIKVQNVKQARIKTKRKYRTPFRDRKRSLDILTVLMLCSHFWRPETFSQPICSRTLARSFFLKSWKKCLCTIPFTVLCRCRVWQTQRKKCLSAWIVLSMFDTRYVPNEMFPVPVLSNNWKATMKRASGAHRTDSKARNSWKEINLFGWERKGTTSMKIANFSNKLIHLTAVPSWIIWELNQIRSNKLFNTGIESKQLLE